MIAYLECPEANTHDVHICGEGSVVVVVSTILLGRRMDCSESRSMGGGVSVLVVAAGTAARK